MKVLFVTRKFPPSVGGMELFARDLSQALADKTDIRLIKWGGHGRAKAVLIAVPYLFMRSFFALLRGSIDVIHLQDGLLAPSGRVLSFIFRKPYVVVIHGLDTTYTNPIFKLLVPRAVARADMVLCISQAAADEAVRHGVPQPKIRVLPLAVNDDIYGLSNRDGLLQQLNLPGDSQTLLTVGRLVKRKGVAWFIENVLPDLVLRFPQLVYLVSGDGKDRPNIEAAIGAQNMQDHVRLLGRSEPELLAAAYNGADVFVMPNIQVPGDMEGFGLVLLEAALCARPIVASNFEGIKDAVVDGQNGRLVKSADPTAFCEEITAFLQDRNMAQVFGENARQFTLENYSWNTIAARYLEIYDQLLH